ncbi:threonine synthase [Enterocloster bolteae]|uniref:threonine synthase n=1 Tax=Enterocloster bolteae TaxID=208479 RepID=UPI00210C1C9D|nr:pyridoxal-phosphate dependent enzyme [Enterocloster bolteae]MCQ5145979.1 pyridoxal-phosphate dependent enzyme [Enterocloster bolteae]
MYTGKVRCLKCGHIFEQENLFEGCPDCRTSEFVSNVTPIYELPKTNGRKECFMEMFPNDKMETYHEMLPFKEKRELVDLGVGNTAVTKLGRLSDELGIELYIKDETRNPTWGHKDRLNAVLVNKAIEMNAPGVIYASTGNNGASGAAFAAKAGIPCIIMTVKGVNKTLETFMQVYGAGVVGVETGEDRWKVLKYMVDKYGWYPATNYTVPIVGSNAWAMEGYKLIAYELFKQMDVLPDKIVVPICYGDALFGIMKGFTELKEMGFIDKIPQMVSVEDYGPVAKAYNSGSDLIKPVERWGSVASSMSTVWGTYHALYALRQSKGIATTLSDNHELNAAQQELAEKEGVYCESASAAAYAGLKKLLSEGKIKQGENVALLITASGVKDTEVTSSYLQESPMAGPDIESVIKVLKGYYHINLG